MRLWVLVCGWLTVCGCVNGQVNFRNPQPGIDPNTRIGLVSEQLGIRPVPGGQIGREDGSHLIDRCVCLPVNQVCPRPDQFNSVVRIAHRPTAGACPNQKMCCPDGHRPRPPVPPTVSPPRPPPVVPQPLPFNGCGTQNPIPYRTARFPEADFGEYPWVAVVLDHSNNYLGGGVLVNNEWVLTAAHKIFGKSSVKVRLGELDVSQVIDHPTLPHVEVFVDRIVLHPNFNNRSLINDVGLLHLSQPINHNNYPHIGPACLPDQGQIFAGNDRQRCWVTGWGKDAFGTTGNFQTILKEVDVPMIDHFDCQEKLKRTRLGSTFNLDPNSFVCAGGEIDKDACTGDGGSPLVCQGRRGWTVAGLVAWGIGCAERDIPGVYVKVSSFVNFINGVIR